VALKKPSDLFGNKSEDNNDPIIESDNTFREELNKVESLSEQLQQLQQELTQKVVKNDLESLVLSQINTMQENFEVLQTEFRQSNNNDLNRFKEIISEVTKTVNHLVENEIPKYRKHITSNEVRFGNQLTEFKEEVEDRVQKFYQVLNEFNDVVQVIDTVSNIEKYLQEHHQDIITLREEVFSEINQIPVGNLQENIERLERKIDLIKETYSSIDPETVAKEIIQEGLLNELPEIKNEDPLTPLNQNFVTIDQLQEHYRLFINRIQQQLSTLGGGGETRLEFLDDINRTSAKVNGRFLKYDAASGKWIGALGGGGSQTLDDTLELGNTSSTGMSVGVVTATSFYGDGSKLTGIVTSVVGLASEGYVNNLVAISTNGLLNSTGDGSSLTGIVTSITAGSGISINQSTGNVTITATNGGGAGESYWASTSAGIHTLSSVGIGTTAKSDFKLYVEGNAKVTGILTVGNQSVTINGSNNTIKVGSGVTIDGNTGIISASAVYIGGSQVSAFSGNYNDLTNKPNLSSISVAYASTAGISTYATSAGISTVAQGLTGTPNITVGIVTATSYNGSGAALTGIITSLIAGTNVTITQSSGIATISATGGGGGSQTLDQTLALGNTSALGMSVGVITATTLNVTGIATIGTGIVTTLRGTNINYTGVSTFTSTFITNVNVSGVATIGTGIVTTLRGTTLNYTGVSTFSSGPVLISSTGTATTTGTALQPLQVTGGAYVSGSVGVGTTNPRENLDVIGSIGVQASGATNRFEIVHNSSLNSLDFIFV
jgi:hypothetical protein